MSENPDQHMDAARELIGELQDGVCGCDRCVGIIREALATSFAEGMKRAAEICDVLADREDVRALEAEDNTDILAHRCTEIMGRQCASMILAEAEAE